MDHLPLASFRGNRFNILFFDAAGVYFLGDMMKEYCTFSERNRLIDAVAKDLTEECSLVGGRALGIVGKLITGPLWRFLVSKQPFSAMYHVYNLLTEKLAVWSGDAADLPDGSGRPFPDAEVNTTTPVFHRLVSPAESDPQTKELLQLLSATFHSYMPRAWQAYLPGGELELSSHLASSSTTTQNLPKTNTISEHDFGQLDRFLREKPNATILASESMVMLANNKTMAWLATKSEEDRAQILRAARASVPQQQELARQRKTAIDEHRRQVVLQQQEKKKQQQQRQAQLVQESTLALSKFGGLWTSDSAVNQNLERLTTQTTKREALKCQLRLVMKQYCKENASRFAFSKDGKQLAISEIRDNLLTLIGASSPSATTSTPPAEEYLPEPEPVEEDLPPEDTEESLAA